MRSPALTLEGNKPNRLAVGQALLAALLFGLNAPLAKLLLQDIPPIYMAAFLYLGAAAGMTGVWLLSGARRQQHQEASLTRDDRLWVILMILLDIGAPFLLMLGLARTSAASTALLSNFEIAATALVALLFFKEAIGRRIWFAIGLMTLASMVLSVKLDTLADLAFAPGSLLVLGACLCWGLENNCTRNLSAKNPLQVVVIKGLGSGSGALLLALASPVRCTARPAMIAGALGLGFVSYGLSIYFYVKAQRWLGAARTSMYYAAAPFIGVLMAMLLLGERPDILLGIGAVLMLAGTAVALREKHSHRHFHARLYHEHPHQHLDGHHTHSHPASADPAIMHVHPHEHEAMTHEHEHNPDLHHRHPHGQD